MLHVPQFAQASCGPLHVPRVHVLVKLQRTVYLNVHASLSLLLLVPAVMPNHPPQCPVIQSNTYTVSSSGKRLVHGDVCTNPEAIIPDTGGKGRVGAGAGRGRVLALSLQCLGAHGPKRIWGCLPCAARARAAFGVELDGGARCC